MARIDNLTNFLTDVATSIKAKTGDSSLIPASQFDTKIAGITTGKLSNEEYTKANNNLDEILYQSQNVLPDTYQEVEYLEASGTQYIDTNFTPNINTKAYAEFYVSTTPCGLYSSDSGASLSTNFSSYISGSGKWRFGSGVATVSISSNSFYTSIQDKTGITINGTNFYDYDTTISDFTSTKTITLLRTNTVGFKGKIYKFKLYDGNNIVRNFIPCYRKSDEKPGMYDTVNGVFYTNDGTGEFIFGVTENALPSVYQEVEYLESNGTQYIDTGYAFTEPELKIVGKYRKTSTLGRNVFGLDFWPNTPRKIHGNIYNKALYLGNSSVVTNITQALNEDYIFEFEFKNNVAKWIINGIEYTYNGANGWEGVSDGETDYLFASRGLNGPGYVFTGRIYYVKFYDNNGDLVRNFVPCYRKLDNKPGMYDVVNGVFYTNEGTGDFVVGADVDVLNTKIESILTEKNTKIRAENIKKNVTAFGITGTYEGLDTSDANATVSDIVTNKTAYVNGQKLTGSLVINKYYTGSGSPSSSLGIDGDLYLEI